MKCEKFFHGLFHVDLGSERQTTTGNFYGAASSTDFHISYHRCLICKKKWAVDHTEADREWEALRDKLVKGIREKIK